jgi:hypothetical protein
MSRFLAYALAVVVLLLNACTTTAITPSQVESDSADYGIEVTLSDFNELAKAKLSGELIDPFSLLYYQPLQISKTWATDSGGQNFFGYFGCFEFNSKNRMGGYAGKSKQCMFVRDKVVIQRYNQDTKYGFFTPTLHTIDRKVSAEALKSAAALKVENDIPRSLSFSIVDSFSAGITTIKDAKSYLGEPTSTSDFGNGTTLLQWIKLTGGKGGHIAVLFDRRGNMIRVTHKFIQ